LDLTLKALANSSPGFALKPWGKMHAGFVATLKELRRVFGYPGNPFRVYVFCNEARLPRVAKRNPGLKLANAFSVNLKLHYCRILRLRRFHRLRIRELFKNGNQLGLV
jgi:hypothetical protein